MESQIRQLVDEVTKIFTAQGKLIEAGWHGFRIQKVPKDAGENELSERRMTFFAGAQHLFSSIMSLLDPGEEPTDADLKKMDLIYAELKEFLREYKEKHFI